MKYTLLGAFTTAITAQLSITALIYQQALLCGVVFGVGTYIIFRLGELKGLNEFTNTKSSSTQS